MPPSSYPFPNCFVTDHLLIHACDLDTAAHFFNNFGWMLFISGCDLHLTVLFFATLDGSILGCDLYITFVFFFTTLHGCCLFLVVICTSLFIFFKL